MKVKILHLISNKTGIGGAEKFLLDMAGEYDSDRFTVSYCTIFSEGENLFVKELRKRGFDCYEIKGASWRDLPLTIKKLVKFLRREKFDIVHTQLLHGSIAGQLAARFAGVPVRLMTRQYTTDCYHDGHERLKKLDGYVARKAHKVIAISAAVRDDLINERVKPENIELIYNGIDLKPFGEKESGATTTLRKDFPDKYLIGFVANLNHRKGHEYLLRAIAELVPCYNDTHLLLIGEGDLRQSLEKLTGELKIENNVSFLGYQSNVPAILRQLDLYVHASVLEPLGIAVLEAMASEACVVATAVGGVPEIIQNGETGFLVAPRSAKALAETIENVRENRVRAAEIAKAGRERAEKAFDIKVIVEEYQKVYEASLTQRRAKSTGSGQNF